MHTSLKSATAVCFSLWGLCSMAFADAGADAHFLPRSTAIYVELPSVPAVIELLNDHSITQTLRETEQWRQARQSPQYYMGQFVLNLIELKLNVTLPEAVEMLTSGGVALAFDAESQSTVLISDARDAESLNRLLNTLVTMARDDAKNKKQPDPIESDEYRGLPIWKVDRLRIAVCENRLVLTDRDAMAERILDGLLDGTEDSLADVPQFQAAKQTWATLHSSEPPSDSQQCVARGYFDVAALRAKFSDTHFYQGMAKDFGEELILGDLLEVLQDADWASWNLGIDEQGLSVAVQAPFDRDHLSEPRQYCFPPVGETITYFQPELPGTILTLNTYRDLSQLWLRAGDLLNAEAVDQLANADSTLTTLFSGNDFGEDILGSFRPEVTLLAVNKPPTEGDRPEPELKLPAFALVFEMRTPEATWRELRRIYQSLAGFLNVVGAMEGQPQLELQYEELADTEVVSSRYLVPTDLKEGDPVPVQFNFSPAVSRIADRFVLSTNVELIHQLLQQNQEATAPQPSTAARQTHTQIQLNAGTLQDILLANRGQLVANNMLEKGHALEEAEREIDALFLIVGLFRDAEAKLSSSSEDIRLDLQIHVKDAAHD